MADGRSPLRLMGPELNTIWKYPVSSEDEFVLDMPAGSIPLSVAIQDGSPFLWAAVNSDGTEWERHRFFLRGTGHPFPDLLLHRFIGTFQIEGFGGLGLVFHLFDGGPLGENHGQDDR